MYNNHASVRGILDGLWKTMPERVEAAWQVKRHERERFEAEVDLAVARRDNLAICASTLARRADGPLNARRTLDFSRALIAVERFADASEIAGRPCALGEANGKVFFEWTRALAGEGRFAEAVMAAQAAAAHGAPAAARLAEKFATVVRLESVPRDWRTAQDLLAVYVEYGARERATQLVRQLLENWPPVAPKTTKLALGVARHLVNLLPAAEAQAGLDRIAALGVNDPSFDLLRMACDAELQEDAGDLFGAVKLFKRLATAEPTDLAIRGALARAIGRSVLEKAPLHLAAPSSEPRRVFNVLPFFDEFAMLDLRLAEMSPWVDRFVIVESRQTFAGAPKDLQFAENRHRYAAWGDRILHVAIDQFPKSLDTAWARDFYQRDMATAALSGIAREDDMVLITDADEIVRREAVEPFAGDIARLTMGRYMFFLNLRPAEHAGPGGKNRYGPTGIAVRARHLTTHGASYLRFAFARQKQDFCAIPDAGWHFMSVKSASALSEKYRNYAHQEHDPARNEEAYLAERIDRFRRGEPVTGWERCEIDETYPDYIRERPAALADFIL